MAAPEQGRRSNKDGFWASRLGAEILGCGCLALAVYLGLAAASFSLQDHSSHVRHFPVPRIANVAGLVGAQLAGSLIYALGALIWAVPFAIAWFGWQSARRQLQHTTIRQLLGVALLVLAVAFAAATLYPRVSFEGFPLPTAGQLGLVLESMLTHAFGKLGAVVLVAAIGAIGLMLIGDFSLLSLGHHNFLKLKDRFRLPRWRRRQPAVELAKMNAEAALVQIFAADPIPGPAEPAVWSNPEIASGPELWSMPGAQVQTDPLYQPPSPSLFRLRAGGESLSAERREDVESTAKALVQCFSDFGIAGKVGGIQPGPVVTVYEFEPMAGTKLSRMIGLADDIALALKVDSIFIYPVSGKTAVGVQVPNACRETVLFGDIVRSAAFLEASSPLTFVMGKSISGQPVCSDLASMPHLLTAGQTGSGKSVFINGLLCSFIMKAAPEQVKFILVDPKILELKVYEGIPHLLMPVITEPMRASLALKWATVEMDRRYKFMENAKVRHISGFNDFWARASSSQRQEFCLSTQESIPGKLPYIVIVIDELADLMLTAPKDVESSIQRLAQKARASGIHLVLATQRPSVDVITGVIKANLPCRTAFKVFSRADGRTILDSIGAEKLLGKGDMLFLKPGSQRLERIQGAFLEDEEVVRLVDAIRTDGESHYDEEAIAWIEQALASAGDSSISDDFSDADEPKWNDALTIARQNGTISASYLQRSLKIGYNRAARIVERMESMGMVERADGAKARKWLGSRP